MARPVETTLSYFPLYCDFFANEKIKSLRRAYGSIGISAYLFILCKVYDNGYYYKVKNLDSFAHDIAESIANKQLDTVAARVRESIDYMADSADLLSRSCLNMGILTSKSIQEQYSDTTSKFRRKSQIGEYNLLCSVGHMEETAVNAEETAVNAEETPRKREGNRKEETSLKRGKEVPTLEEITAYCSERNNNIDAQRFYDYYAATGWKIRGQRITDWQALVRRWESNGSDSSVAHGTKVTSEELDALFTHLSEET